MTADDRNEQAPAADDALPQETAPRKPAAAAASRARRIGGRVTAAPRSATAQQETEAPAAKPGTQPKPVLAKPARPSPTPAPSREPAGAAPVVLPGWLRWAPTGILSAGAVAMAVVLIVFSHGVWWARPAGSTVREHVLAAAKTCTATTNTYTYTALDSFEAKALRCTTGAFTGKVRHTIESLIKKNAPRLKASQRVQINRGGIESVTDGGDRWKVILFGQLSATNVNNAKSSAPDPFAVQVIMQKAHGKWLMADLNPISSPLS
jgi:hypothetical protein